MNNITIVGRIGRDPELRFTKDGKAVASFSVATDHGRDDNKKTTWHNVTVFGQYAEHAAATIEKGSNVIVVGKLDISSYEKDGQKKYVTKILADEVGLLCRWNPVVADKTEQVMQKVTQAFGQPKFLDDEPF